MLATMADERARGDYTAHWQRYRRRERIRMALRLAAFLVGGLGVCFLRPSSWQAPVVLAAALTLIVIWASTARPLRCPRCNAAWKIQRKLWERGSSPAIACETCGLKYLWSD